MSKYYLERAKEITRNWNKKEDEKGLTKCLKILTFDENCEYQAFCVELSSPGYLDKLYSDMNFQAKVIAAYVRENIEDFHCKYLNDEQMKELNPLIRNAIYTALYDMDFSVARTYMVQKFNLPSYWEDCEYVEHM